MWGAGSSACSEYGDDLPLGFGLVSGQAWRPVLLWGIMAKKSFPLRMEEEAFALLQRWADDEFRSVNGQIEFLLREALRQADRWKKTVDRTAVSSETVDGEQKANT